MAEKEVGEMFLSLVQDIATELDLGVLCHKILVNVGRLTSADRGSLFLVEQTQEEAPNVRQYLVPKLFDVTVESGK
jgi:cGMP-specific 3',5'-cyclic phosphodiesterase